LGRGKNLLAGMLQAFGFILHVGEGMTAAFVVTFLHKLRIRIMVISM